jgi:hypothetical protein
MALSGRDFISLSNGDKETEAKKTPTDASFEVSLSVYSWRVGSHAADVNGRLHTQLKPALFGTLREHASPARPNTPAMFLA